MIRDKGLGIDLIETRDLVDSSSGSWEGSTIKLSLERARVRRFDDTGKIKTGPIAGLSGIRFWVILDCGDKGRRFLPTDSPFQTKGLREDKYVVVGVGVGQEIADAEMEETGVALPDTYYSLLEAQEACSDLVTVARIHES